MKKIYGSAAALAVAGIAAKLIGAMHKLPLIALLGAEGTGLYQLAMPVYAAVLMLMSGGSVAAVSRESAREGGRAISALKAGALLSLVAGTAGGAFLALAGGGIAALQGNANAAPSYLALAPAVPLSCMLASLRGWWQGRRNLMPTAVSQLSEQAVKLVCGLALASAMMPHGAAYAVAGATLGITAGECATCAVMLVAAVFSARKAGKEAEEKAVKVSDALWRIVKDAVPISLGALVLPALALTDSVMIVNILMNGGISASAATALYGAASAPASAIAGLPPMLTAAYAAALLPVLTSGSEEEKRRATASTAGMAFLAGAAGAAVMIAFPREITDVLYPSGPGEEEMRAAVTALRAAGVGTIFSCMKQITSASLQAEGRAYVSALTMLGAGAVKAALTALTVRVFGAGGGAIATAAAYALSFAADAYFARKSLKRVSVPTFLKCSLAVAAGCFGGIAARFLPVEGALPVAIVCGSVFCLTTLLVLVITDTFGLAGKIATKAKIFGALFFNKTKKY